MVKLGLGQDSNSLPALLTKPLVEDLGQTLAQHISLHDPAVKQQRGRMHKAMRTVRGAVLGQEFCQMAGDRRVGGVGQPHLLKTDPPVRLGSLGNTVPGKEPIDQTGFDFLVAQVRADTAANHPTAASENCDGMTLGVLGLEQILFCRPAALAQSAKLPGVELGALSGEALLDAVGQAQVHIVAAEEDVVADRDPFEHQLASLFRYRDQAQIGRSSTHIAHQDHIPDPDVFAPPVTSRLNPGVARGLGFFEQAHRRQAGLLGSLDGQLASRRIKRGRHGQKDLLVLQSVVWIVLGHTRIPGLADMP